MRNIALTTLAALVLAGLASAATAQPRLRLTEDTPLIVAGTGFRSHEHVKVVYRAEQTWTRNVIATTAGSFRARFAGVTFQACKLHRLTATGSLGSRAVFRMPPIPCQPPTTEP